MPDHYHEREVVVRGFLVLQKGVSLLFFNTESIKHHIGKNAIRIELSNIPEGEMRMLTGHKGLSCCTIKGKVAADQGGPNGLGVCTLIVTKLHNLDLIE